MNSENSLLKSQVAYLSGLIAHHKSKQNRGQPYSRTQPQPHYPKYSTGYSRFSVTSLPNVSKNRSLSKNVKLRKPEILNSNNSALNKYKIDKLCKTPRSNSSSGTSEALHSVKNRFKVVAKANLLKATNSLSNSSSHEMPVTKTKSANNYVWKPKPLPSASKAKANNSTGLLSNSAKVRTMYKLVNNGASNSSAAFKPEHCQQNKAQFRKSIPSHVKNLKKIRSANLLKLRSSQLISSSNINRNSRRLKLKSSVTSKLVRINDVMYETSASKLQKRRRRSSNRLLIPVVAKLNKSRKLINAGGVKFYIDQSSKKLVRLRHVAPSIPKRASPSISTRSTSMKQKNITYFSTFSNKRVVRIQNKYSLRNLKRMHSIPSSISPATSFVNRVVNRSINNVRNSKNTCYKKKIGATAGGYCMFFNRFGKCNKGKECAYIHDPDKIAVCTRFLRGTCKVTDCPFSHKLSQDKMPVCSFFLKGKCIIENCPYRHVNVNPNAALCKDFISGFCPKRSQCKKLHSLTCVSFMKNGKCDKGFSCPLKHLHVKQKKIEARGAINIPKGSQGSQEMEFDGNGKGPSYISLVRTPSIEEVPDCSKKLATAPGTGLKIQPSFLKLQ